MKSVRIVIPIEEKMREDITKHVLKKGFDSMAAYIRMLIRDDLYGEKSGEEHF